MRKTLITSFIVLLSLVMLYGVADAIVTGVCSSCHTMHDSQGGVADTEPDGVGLGTTGTQANLLIYSCFACHTTGGSEYAPKIDGTAAATGIGGPSNYVTAGGDVNVGSGVATRHDVLSSDTSQDMEPPGYSDSGGLDWTDELVTCDGEFGCHGKHKSTDADKGVNGMHHTADSAYRWLYVQAGNSGADDGTAVNGEESGTWEAGGAELDDHNVYDGDGDNSISAFCSNCHSDYHASGNTGSSSPFTRHPTDEEGVISVVVDGDFTTPTLAQLRETPFAFTGALITSTLAVDSMTGYTTANGTVMCLSCHKAHGSVYDDLLRFNYSTMNAGNSTNNNGCETCHVAQR